MYKGKFGSQRPHPEPTSPEKPPMKAKPRRRQPSLGGTIFYTLYVFFIALFCLCVFLNLQWLDRWLKDYEAAHHTLRSQEVFERHFADPKWEDLYALCSIQDTLYENRDTFAAHMQQQMEGKQLTYQEIPTDLPHTRQYNVLLDGSTIAVFSMTDRRQLGSLRPETIGQLPDWQLNTLELFFRRDRNYRIVMPETCSASVNGVRLDDTHTLLIAVPRAASYLPKGVSAIRMRTQEVAGLFNMPQVTITDKQGNSQPVVYDEATLTFTVDTGAMTDEERTAVEAAAEVSALWLISQVTDPETLKKHFDPKSEAYDALLGASRRLPQALSSYELAQVQLAGFTRYGTTHFSVTVDALLKTQLTGGTAEERPYHYSLLFEKQADGFRCIQWLEEELSAPVGRVKLTFKLDDQAQVSEYYSTSAREIITPIINAPEGMIFSGWVTKAPGPDGQLLVTPVFHPDHTGRAVIPEGSVLEPMTLYAHFEPLGK